MKLKKLGPVGPAEFSVVSLQLEDCLPKLEV